jgi:hypothetical protein
MNDQQIYALMAKTPKIRAVQIADALDVDLEDVNEKLRFLVSMGDIVQSNGFSPNGHAAQVYDLSEKSRSRQGIAPLPAIQPPATEQSVASVEAPMMAPTPSAAPSAAPAASISPTSDEPGRAARALAFIETHGSATDAQLRAIMGLKDDVFPSSYLNMAVKAGKVVKVGREWKIGDGRPLRPLKRQPAFGVPLNLPGASPFDVPTPPPAAPKVKRQTAAPVPTEAPTPAPPAAPAQPLRCGVWLDGMFELRRGSVTTELTQAEAQVLRAFLNRVLPAEESA